MGLKWGMTVLLSLAPINLYFNLQVKIPKRKSRSEMGLLNNLQELYRTFVGPKWTQNEPAELYNVHKEFLTFDQFKMVMTNLPDYVSESQAEEIFRIADKDGNGYISYTEFKESGSAASAITLQGDSGGRGPGFG